MVLLVAINRSNSYVGGKLNQSAYLDRLRMSCIFVPSYLQILQPTFESLHGLAQLVYGIAGIPGQVPHGVLDVFLPPGALTSGLARRRLGCCLASHQLRVELLDGALMAHDGLLLLQDGLPEVDDRVPQLVLHGAAALDTVSRGTKPAARLCARGNGVTHEAATCSILASHRASTEKVQKSNYQNQHPDWIRKFHLLKGNNGSGITDWGIEVPLKIRNL